MMTLRACLCLAALLFGLADAGANPVGKKLTPDARQQCLSGGGTIGILGLSGSEGCIHTMPDAGKACTDDVDCKAGCFYQGPKVPKFGTPVTGACARTDSIFGCRTHVANGKAEESLCVD